MLDRTLRPDLEKPARPAAVRWGDLAGLFDGADLPDQRIGSAEGDGFESLRRQMAGLDPDLHETIAARLAQRPDLPHDIALTLAHDRIGVARPVLRSSPVLSEADLMEVIDQRSREHHLAIARRNTVGAMLTELLVEMGDHEILLTLLENPGAQLRHCTVARLIAACRHDETLRIPLLRRSELTDDQAQALALWVVDDSRQGLVAEDGAAVMRMPGRPEAASPDQAPPEVRGAGPGHDHTHDDTTETQPVPASTLVKSLISALRRDNIPELESIIARLTGLPPFAVDRVLYNVTPEPLAIVCRALSLKRPLFAALYLRLQGSKPDENARTTPHYRDALVYFTRLQTSQAARVLETWQRAPVTVWHNPRGSTSRAYLAS